MFTPPFKYYNMSRHSGKSKPVTAESLRKSKISSTVKPITKRDVSKESKEEEFYRKYGIIYAGGDLKSCFSSLFN